MGDWLVGNLVCFLQSLCRNKKKPFGYKKNRLQWGHQKPTSDPTQTLPDGNVILVVFFVRIIRWKRFTDGLGSSLVLTPWLWCWGSPTPPHGDRGRGCGGLIIGCYLCVLATRRAQQWKEWECAQWSVRLYMAQALYSPLDPNITWCHVAYWFGLSLAGYFAHWHCLRQFFI